MATADILEGKTILAVDDEEDVLEVIREQLDSCRVVSAQDFHGAKQLLETQQFDLVILDIMGVRGFDLLDLAAGKKLPAVMLTAHSITPESLQRSIDSGAVSFLPKDKLAELAGLIREILGDVSRGETHWPRLEKILGPKFSELWGKLWDEIKFPRDPKISW
ncbi:response regulator [Thermodesulfobacteriota bacterium]